MVIVADAQDPKQANTRSIRRVASVPVVWPLRSAQRLPTSDDRGSTICTALLTFAQRSRGAQRAVTTRVFET